MNYRVHELKHINDRDTINDRAGRYLGEYLGITAGLERDGVVHIWFREETGLVSCAAGLLVVLETNDD